MPAAGGDENQVVASFYGRNYTFDSRGIYFIAPRGDDGKFPLAWLPSDGGKPKAVLDLPHAPLMGLRRVSRAFHTTPIPPAPSFSTIW